MVRRRSASKACAVARSIQIVLQGARVRPATAEFDDERAGNTYHDGARGGHSARISVP